MHCTVHTAHSARSDKVHQIIAWANVRRRNQRNNRQNTHYTNTHTQKGGHTGTPAHIQCFKNCTLTWLKAMRCIQDNGKRCAPLLKNKILCISFAICFASVFLLSSAAQTPHPQPTWTWTLQHGFRSVSIGAQVTPSPLPRASANNCTWRWLATWQLWGWEEAQKKNTSDREKKTPKERNKFKNNSIVDWIAPEHVLFDSHILVGVTLPRRADSTQTTRPLSHSCFFCFFFRFVFYGCGERNSCLMILL